MESRRIKKTRNRSTIVCTNCRRKKIKCDKKQPCSNCIKLNSEQTCAYSLNHSQLTSSGSESDGNNIKLLRSQVDDLVSQISAMKKIITKEGNFIIPENPKPKQPSIFDSKLPDLNKALIFSKPSRTTCFSSLVGQPLSNTNGFQLFSFCGFRQLLDRERSVWKQKNKKELNRENIELIISKKIDYDEVLDVVDKIIVANYEAFSERLQYFTTNLNKLLYSEFIPMDIVVLKFESFFRKKSKQKIIFSPPKKDYDYSSLSLVVSLVNLSCVFTKYEETNFFKHPLDISTIELCKLSNKFLGISNYKRKINLFSLYALITLRSCKFIYGNSESAGIDDENAFPMFQECLDLCYILGLHLPGDRVIKIQMPKKADEFEFFYTNMVSPTCQKLLWNYMQRLDAWYSVSIGTPLLINYEFCNEYYDLPGEEFRAEYVIQVRNVSKTMNSKKLICLNDLLTLIDDLLKFYSQLIPAQEFEKIYTVSENIWPQFVMKQQISMIIWNLSIFTITNLSEPAINTHFTAAQLQLPENQDLIKKTTVNLRAKCSVFYISVFKVLKQMCQNIKFTKKLLLYSRKYFVRWFGIPSVNLVDLLPLHDLVEENEPLPNIFELDIYQMEQYLYLSPNESSININYLGKLDLGSIVSFITKIYELIVKIPIFSTTYDFFVKAKVCLIVFYFCSAVMKTDSPEKKGLNQKLVEIGKKSREKLEHKMNVGVLDERLELCERKDNHAKLENSGILNINYGENSNNEIDDAFSSIMEDQELIDLFKELDNVIYDYSNESEWVNSMGVRGEQ